MRKYLAALVGIWAAVIVAYLAVLVVVVRVFIHFILKIW